MESSGNKIGWIGTGVMGNHMCQYLLKANYELYVYNRTQEKAKNLIELGAKFEAPSEIAKKVDFLFLMLGYPKDVEEIVFGKDNNENSGVLANLKAGSYLIDHTTSSPDLAVKIAEEAKKRNVFSYDAPVSGGEIGAKEGRLVVMTGGEEANFEKAKEIMSKYSSKVNLMGGPGMGQHTKMANQIIIVGGMIGVVEGLLYAYKAKLDLNNVIALLGGGAAGSFSLNVYGPKIVKRDFEPGFYVEHMVKDMGIALKECEKMGLKLEGLELANKFYKLLVEEGNGRKGTQALMLVIEKLNKTEIKQN